LTCFCNTPADNVLALSFLDHRERVPFANGNNVLN
jgi:hypothetical protein